MTEASLCSVDEPTEPPLTLNALMIYPIKSAGGTSLRQALIEPRGLQHDRRWMVMNANGKLMTQRDLPKMRHIEVEVLPDDCATDRLQVSAPDMPLLRIPRVPQGSLRSVRIWADTTQGVSVSEQASRWLSEFLGTDCELLYMPDEIERYQPNRPFTSLLSFADGNPFHLVSEASIADLNARLAHPVHPEVFRPNLVVSGGRPYAEDYWRRIAIGALEFQVVESCDRCNMLNITQAARMTAEPLRTLAKYRRRGRAVPFGQNVIQGVALYQPGSVVRVGDAVRVLQQAEQPNPTYFTD